MTYLTHALEIEAVILALLNQVLATSDFLALDLEVNNINNIGIKNIQLVEYLSLKMIQ